MTAEQKEKIDYKIQAKIKARNKDIADWGCAGLLAILFFLFLLIIG